MIDAEKANHSITRMAELLALSRSGYYAWAARKDAPPGPRAVRTAELTVKILDFHAASDHVNGAPRILADLREDGESVSRKTVARIMRANGIRGISPRPWQPVTTICDDRPHHIPDLVERRFDQGALNLVWTSDAKCRHRHLMSHDQTSLGAPAMSSGFTFAGWVARVSPSLDGWLGDGAHAPLHELPPQHR